MITNVAVALMVGCSSWLTNAVGRGAEDDQCRLFSRRHLNITLGHHSLPSQFRRPSFATIPSSKPRLLRHSFHVSPFTIAPLPPRPAADGFWLDGALPQPAFTLALASHYVVHEPLRSAPYLRGKVQLIYGRPTSPPTS
jgi:hypothetical protein